MDEQNTAIFSQAKLEYTNQLIDILTPHIFDGIKSIYDEAKTVNSVNSGESITLLFRNFLEKVPSWSNILIETETERIIKISDCDWLDDLITAVFISHTKILTSIGTNTTNNHIDLIIPKITKFIHKCYINIAREMWKNPYFFTENVIASEYQKNMRTVEIMIKESIENTIRHLLPIKEILKQNLEKTESLKKTADKSDIRELLLEEIKNLNLVNILQNGNNINSIEQNIKESIDDEVKDLENKIIDREEEKLINEEEELHGGLEAEPEKYYNDEDDYESVDEETIKKNCENLEINTIDDVENKNIVEETYDNANIIDKNENKGSSLLEKFMDSLKITDQKEEYYEDEVKKEVDDNIVNNTIKEYTKLDGEDSVKNDKINIEKVDEVEKVREIEKVDEVEKDTFDINEIQKKPEKELISVDKIADDETVDEFFNDVSRMIEEKTGEIVNKNPEKYILFSDAENE
jgi:hypothetical protein